MEGISLEIIGLSVGHSKSRIRLLENCILWTFQEKQPLPKWKKILFLLFLKCWLLKFWIQSGIEILEVLLWLEQLGKKTHFNMV